MAWGKRANALESSDGLNRGAKAHPAALSARILSMSVAEEADRQRALLLQWATVLWNLGEAILTISLGVASGSLALIGFGSDSIIEIFTSLVVVRHVRLSVRDRIRAQRRTMRLVALAFLLLAGALAIAAGHDLIASRKADASVFGIVYLAVTALVMFSLAIEKHRLARRTGLAPLAAEASMTMLDGVLSVATLLGLALNAWLGWWWADPSAALVVAMGALNESRETWKKSYGDPTEN
jgi:divalent metal cation (Fe/Co/Zn/Cd) transporter